MDIFGRKSSETGAGFSSDDSTLTFQAKGANGTNFEAGLVHLLVQTMTANYSQTVTRVFELGTAISTFIQGRTQGSLSLGRIIGPRASSQEFISEFSSVCTVSTNNILFRLKQADENKTAACNNGSTEGFQATGCLIQSVSYTVAAENVVIQQQIQMQIISLDEVK